MNRFHDEAIHRFFWEQLNSASNWSISCESRQALSNHPLIRNIGGDTAKIAQLPTYQITPSIMDASICVNGTIRLFMELAASWIFPYFGGQASLSNVEEHYQEIPEDLAPW